MSGVVGVVLAAIAATGRFDAAVQSKWFWAAAVVFVFVAMFQAWLHAHRGQVATEQRAEGLQRNLDKAGETALATIATHLGDLKAKVGSSSPDEIKARIDDLEARLAALAPRRLKSEQVAAITRAALVMTEHGRVGVAYDETVPDARFLARDIEGAFKSAGWHISFSHTRHLRERARSGIALEMKKATGPTPTEAVVAEALSAAKLKFDVRDKTLTWTDAPSEMPIIIVTYEGE